MRSFQLVGHLLGGVQLLGQRVHRDRVADPAHSAPIGPIDPDCLNPLGADFGFQQAGKLGGRAAGARLADMPSYRASQGSRAALLHFMKCVPGVSSNRVEQRNKREQQQAAKQQQDLQPKPQSHDRMCPTLRAAGEAVPFRSPAHWQRPVRLTDPTIAGLN